MKKRITSLFIFLKKEKKIMKSEKKLKRDAYLLGKGRAIEEAIEYQMRANTDSESLDDILMMNEHFTKLAKRYGLIKEFKENGII